MQPSPWSPNSILVFFNDTATTEIYTLSLHDALPIWIRLEPTGPPCSRGAMPGGRTLFRLFQSGPIHRRAASPRGARQAGDRKSTRLNSSHSQISYAVFCLKKKNTNTHLYQSKLHVLK